MITEIPIIPMIRRDPEMADEFHKSISLLYLCNVCRLESLIVLDYRRKSLQIMPFQLSLIKRRRQTQSRMSCSCNKDLRKDERTL